MNGRRFDHGSDLLPLPQLHVLAALVGDEGFERKTTLKTDAHHRSFAIQGPNVPEQAVTRAALRWKGTTFLQHNVLGVDADMNFVARFTIEMGRCESDYLLCPDLNGR